MQRKQQGKGRGRGRGTEQHQSANNESLGRGNADAFRPAPPPGESAWGQRSQPQQQQTREQPKSQTASSVVSNQGSGAWRSSGGNKPSSDGNKPSGEGNKPSGNGNNTWRSTANQASTSHASGAISKKPQQTELGQSFERAVTLQESQTTQQRTTTSTAAPSRAGFVQRRQLHHDIFPTRSVNAASKQGTLGTKIILQSNYFRIIQKSKNQWSLYQYRVDFTPDLESTRLRRGIMFTNKIKFGGYIFDGTVLYTQKHFNDFEFTTKNNFNDEPIRVNVKYVGNVDNTSGQSFQILNLILRQAMNKLQLQVVGRNLFDARASIPIREYNLELWPGYITSIRQHENDILLCAEISHKVMRTDTLYEILQRCVQNNRNYQDAFKNEVLGTTVLTDYNNKTYRIDDIDFNNNPLSKFPKKNGEFMTYTEYYHHKYNINIKDNRQPLLISRPKEKNLRSDEPQGNIALVPELCRATGINDQMRTNTRLMQAMSQHTRIDPNNRIYRLLQFHKRLTTTQDSLNIFNDWNFNIEPKLVEFTGRVLKQQNILFGNKKTYTTTSKCDWASEFKSNSMYSTPGVIKNWGIVTPKQFQHDAISFVQSLIKIAGKMNFHLDEPKWYIIERDTAVSYTNELEKCCQNDPQFVMCVLRNKNRPDLYSCVKKKTLVDRGIVSQVITSQLWQRAKGLDSIACKVAIQINAKLMGAPWKIMFPDNIMSIGFDVCHSTRDKAKSYGAMVGTMDLNKSGQFFSTVSEHIKGTELSNDMVLNAKKMLQWYFKTHNKLPTIIFFYRDGVGEGQLHQVFEHEVTLLKKEFDEIYKMNKIETGCRLAFIVVSKRINTRLFVNGQNPQPGTVADDVVTLPEHTDFFLVSQSVTRGTVSPTQYNVIHDSTRISADHIQDITYRSTHLYYNWAGTTRVPSVCQYAHKLAYLIGENLHQIPHNMLEKQLYFL